MNGVKLHWVEAGAGPLVVLLLGFPEHWYAWRHQIPALAKAGFRCFHPRGAYYIMADISSFGFADDYACVKHLIEKIGVAAVPGSSFYRDPKEGAQQVRFAFCKRDETLDEAAKRLKRVRPAGRKTGG